MPRPTNPYDDLEAGILWKKGWADWTEAERKRAKELGMIGQGGARGKTGFLYTWVHAYDHFDPDEYMRDHSVAIIAEIERRGRIPGVLNWMLNELERITGIRGVTCGNIVTHIGGTLDSIGGLATKATLLFRLYLKSEQIYRLRQTIKQRISRYLGREPTQAATLEDSNAGFIERALAYREGIIQILREQVRKDPTQMLLAVARDLVTIDLSLPSTATHAIQRLQSVGCALAHEYSPYIAELMLDTVKKGDVRRLTLLGEFVKLAPSLKQSVPADAFDDKLPPYKVLTFLFIREFGVDTARAVLGLDCSRRLSAFLSYCDSKVQKNLCQCTSEAERHKRITEYEIIIRLPFTPHDQGLLAHGLRDVFVSLERFAERQQANREPIFVYLDQGTTANPFFVIPYLSTEERQLPSQYPGLIIKSLMLAFARKMFEPNIKRWIALHNNPASCRRWEYQRLTGEALAHRFLQSLKTSPGLLSATTADRLENSLAIYLARAATRLTSHVGRDIGENALTDAQIASLYAGIPRTLLAEILGEEHPALEAILAQCKSARRLNQLLARLHSLDQRMIDIQTARHPIVGRNSIALFVSISHVRRRIAKQVEALREMFQTDTPIPYISIL